LPGDATSHPFLWQRGKMKDLGTVGGTYGYAAWLNDAGAVVGATTIEGDQALLAFFWEKGTMTNLGALSGNTCSAADAINSAGQIVGGSGGYNAQNFPACTDPVEHAVLWDNGKILDLNAFVPASSDLTLTEATFVNDRGEISGIGTLPNGDQHPFLLIPCDANDTEGCKGASEEANATQSTPAPTASATTASQPSLTVRGMAIGSRARLGRGYSSPAVVTPAAPHNLSPSAQNTYQIKLNWQEASGQNQSGFYIYRCHGCSSPRTQGTKVASVGASVFTYTDGSSSHPLTESTNYAYQVTAFNSGGESGPSSAASATTKTEPAPTRLTSITYPDGSFDKTVNLRWTNNSTDDDSYHIERCTGLTCTNFSQIGTTGANATEYNDTVSLGSTFLRYRVRAHSPGGYSGYSGITTVAVRLGSCIVGSSNTLTGYCEGTRGGVCREAYDPNNCPVGKPPTGVQSDECGISGLFKVDLLRSCTP
jgi:probable HAF family extracellular repeat protein